MYKHESAACVLVSYALATIEADSLTLQNESPYHELIWYPSIPHLRLRDSFADTTLRLPNAYSCRNSSRTLMKAAAPPVLLAMASSIVSVCAQSVSSAAEDG